MSKQTPALAAETQAIREAYAALNRNDIPGFVGEPQRFIVAGDRLIVFVHVRVRLKDETDWREGRVGDVYTFRDGKAIEFRTFADERQALEWAGVGAGASEQR